MKKVSCENGKKKESILPQQLQTILDTAPTSSKVVWVGKFVLSTLMKVFAVYLSLGVFILLKLIITLVSMPFTGILPYPQGDPQRSVFRMLKSILRIDKK